jgi:predicted adenylyl cyclase CyaB
MKEVEAKILEVNKNQIEASLARLDAKRVFDGEIEIFFFDFKDGTIVKAKNLLRLKREENRIELTYKKVHETHVAKVVEEYSVSVSDLEAMKNILEFLGLSVTENMRKHRVSYSRDRARFDIDRCEGKYSYIPEFLARASSTTTALQRQRR